MNAACKKEIGLKWLAACVQLCNSGTDPMKALCECQSGIRLSKNESINCRNKHIDINYHFVRGFVARGEVELGNVPIAEMMADLLTKPLCCVKFEYLRGDFRLLSKGENERYEQGEVAKKSDHLLEEVAVGVKNESLRICRFSECLKRL